MSNSIQDLIDKNAHKQPKDATIIWQQRARIFFEELLEDKHDYIMREHPEWWEWMKETEANRFVGERIVKPARRRSHKGYSDWR